MPSNGPRRKSVAPCNHDFPQRDGICAGCGLAICGLCGEALPADEQMFRYHGYSGPCPKKEGA